MLVTDNVYHFHICVMYLIEFKYKMQISIINTKPVLTEARVRTFANGLVRGHNLIFREVKFILKTFFSYFLYF